MFQLLDDISRVARPDLYYFKRNFISIMITILVTPLLYYISFCYGIGSNIDKISGVSYVAFVIPGVISISTLTSCFSSIANKIMVQRVYYSSFDETILCPISTSAVILGKACIGFFKSLLGCAILIFIGLMMTNDMHITLLFILCIIVSCLTYSLLGVVVGFLSNNLSTIIMFTSIIVVPMTFLCGTMFTVSSLPHVLQYVIAAMPLTYSTDCIRAAALDWSFPLLSLIIVIAFGVAFFIICYYLMKKGKV